MAFIFMLVVTLAMLVQVEIQTASVSLKEKQARQNALFALNVALGQLQQKAGPDQRTTATASLGEEATALTEANAADNGLGYVNDGTRYWTGAWGHKKEPISIFTEQTESVLLGWLVSGNENSAQIDVNPNGRILSPSGAIPQTYTPALAVSKVEGGALDSSVRAEADLQLGTAPAKLLVGPGSVGDDVSGYVVAPLVEFSQDDVTASTNRYAWWVGDEGVKARFNLTDPYIGQVTPDAENTKESRESRYRLLASQRNGIERMTGIGDSNYPIATATETDEAYLAIGRTHSLESLYLAMPNVETTSILSHFHDYTPYSSTVLADTQFGGLRRDLSFHLDDQSGDTFLDGRNILPDGEIPTSEFSGSRYAAKPSLFSEEPSQGGLGYTSLNLSPRLGPKWDQVKSFYQTAYNEPTTLEVRPAVDVDADPVVVQSAITPVILDTRLMFAVEQGPKIATTFTIVIGNPYSRPLVASNGLNVRIAHHPFRYDNSFWGEELGLILNYISPIQGYDANGEEIRDISSVFKRKQGTRSKHSPALEDEADLQGPYKSSHFFHAYYPILKFRAPYGANAPIDPDASHPGLLDRVYFQIPPNQLKLAPGEAKAYRIAEGSTLPSETIIENGKSITMKVIPLEEMTDSFPTYYTENCDSYYVNDPNLWSYEAGGFYRGSLNITSQRGAYGATIDFTLTLPNNPESPLSQFTAGNSNTDDVGSTGVPRYTYYKDIFAQVPEPISGVHYYRDFGQSSFSTKPTITQYGGLNLTGVVTSSPRYYDGTSSERYKSSRESTVTGQDRYLTSETAFSTDFDPSNPLQAAWGQEEIGGEGSTRIAPSGQLILRDQPAAQSPEEIAFLSIGQLQHVDLTADDETLSTGLQTGNAVGNSWYSFMVPREDSSTEPDENWSAQRFSYYNRDSEPGDSMRYPGYVPDLPKTDLIQYYDISYLLNAALWDSFYFSGIRPASGSDSRPAPLSANQRLTWVMDTPTLGELRASDASVLIQDPSALLPGENGRAPAAFLKNEGSFNVNSTSVEAWKAVLSGLRGLAANPTETPNPDWTPFARSIRQSGLAQAVLSESVASKDNTYDGYRALTDDQIDALATNIVAQVKARGPFLSLGQFVNRVLTPAADFGDPISDLSISGALQRAIDQTDINEPLREAAPLSPYKNAKIYVDHSLMPTGTGSGIGRYQGAPGWLTQADILESLAPALSARSDTFIIRTYGDVRNPFTNEIEGRAWCEAVVQRIPEYVDDSVRPTVLPSDAGVENQNYGRRFQIMAIRWLSPDEV
ncbi:hypothetical protein [Cerasicoccus fimbriatus]|uniref:hypothetical protein n=1 Tax=Cerasicoccus fimbriatus TaxID=3014554 RepID=UPI0022B50661|nr:hypothetical protein [Cerasicoccus sp. TK19100]